MRIPEAGPRGDTLREASSRAIVGALSVNNPARGYVDSVLTFATQRRVFFFAFLAERGTKGPLLLVLVPPQL